MFIIIIIIVLCFLAAQKEFFKLVEHFWATLLYITNVCSVHYCTRNRNLPHFSSLHTLSESFAIILLYEYNNQRLVKQMNSTWFCFFYQLNFQQFQAILDGEVMLHFPHIMPGKEKNESGTWQQCIQTMYILSSPLQRVRRALLVTNRYGSVARTSYYRFSWTIHVQLNSVSHMKISQRKM